MHEINVIEVLTMSFSEYDVTHRTRKGNFLKQIDQLIQERDKKSDCSSFCTGIGCSRPSEVFWIAVVQNAASRNQARWFKRCVGGRHVKFESARDAVSRIVIGMTIC